MAYRPLTKAELKKLGKNPSTRAYTSQKANVKKLNPEAVVSRRKALQAAGGETLEAKAQRKRIERGGRSPLDRFTRYLDAWRYKLAADTDEPALTRGQARNSPAFKKLYSDSVNDSRRGPRRSETSHSAVSSSRRVAQTRRRLRALHELGAIDDEQYSDLIELYPLDSAA